MKISAEATIRDVTGEEITVKISKTMDYIDKFKVNYLKHRVSNFITDFVSEDWSGVAEIKIIDE